VIEKKAPCSYIVELNGARRQLHADKLRPYITSELNLLRVQLQILYVLRAQISLVRTC
jgi:hypothetical protein